MTDKSHNHFWYSQHPVFGRLRPRFFSILYGGHGSPTIRKIHSPYNLTCKRLYGFSAKPYPHKLILSH